MLRAPRLSAAVLVVIALLTGYALWGPLRAANQALRQSVAEQRAELAWMRQTAAAIKRLEGQHGASHYPQRPTTVSLPTLIDQSARRAGLGPALKHVEPQANNAALLGVQLRQAEFSQLLRWLEGLRSEFGVVVVSAVIDPDPRAGYVNVRLVLQEA